MNETIENCCGFSEGGGYPQGTLPLFLPFLDYPPGNLKKVFGKHQNALDSWNI